MTQDNDGGRVAGSFTMSAQMPNGKQLTFSQYVLATDTVEDINKRLDIASQVVERQRLSSEVPELEAKLKQAERAREEMMMVIEDLSGKVDAAPRNQKERQEIAQAKQTINTMKVNIDRVERDIKHGEIAISAAKRATASLV